MENINRFGIILEFLSFWFLAPEILGEKRLRQLERWFGRLLEMSTLGCAVAVGLGFVLLNLVQLFIYSMRKYSTTTQTLMELDRKTHISWLSDSLESLYHTLFMTPQTLIGDNILAKGAGLALIVICSATVSVFVPIAAYVLALIGRTVIQTLVNPILSQLADDRYTRRRSLRVGVIIFVFGFILQIIATF